MSPTRSRVSDRLDPAWEPNEVSLKVYVTRALYEALDQFSADLKISKSVFAREAIRRGVPALVNDIRRLESQGYRPSTHLTGEVSAGPSRGPQGEGVLGVRWAKKPSALKTSSAEDPGSAEDADDDGGESPS